MKKIKGFKAKTFKDKLTIPTEKILIEKIAKKFR